MPSEADLIAILGRHAGAARDDVVLGIGDDAAVLRPRAGHELVLCVDTLVEGVHFLAGTDPAAVGHKALAVNLSDLAAMGAEPAWALVALTLPAAEPDWAAGFADGFGRLADAHGVRLVGGDTTRGPRAVTVQLAGQLPAGTALTRAGARAGDALYVSGPLGEAALALRALLDGDEPAAALRARLERPTPRVALGSGLRGVAHAAIDVSDGLLTDLARLLAPVGLGATVRVAELPPSPAPLPLQLDGGDDYELLAAAPAGALEPHGMTCIGSVEATPGIVCTDRDGRPVPTGRGGYDAFR